MYDVGYRKCVYEAYCDPKEMKFRIFKDFNLLRFSKKIFLRPPAWDLFSSPGEPETKLYFLLAQGLCYFYTVFTVDGEERGEEKKERKGERERS